MKRSLIEIHILALHQSFSRCRDFTFFICSILNAHHPASGKCDRPRLAFEMRRISINGFFPILILSLPFPFLTRSLSSTGSFMVNVLYGAKQLLKISFCALFRSSVQLKIAERLSLFAGNRLFQV